MGWSALNLLDINQEFKTEELKYYIRINLRLLNSFVSDIDPVVMNRHSELKFEEFNLKEQISNNLDFLAHINEDQPEIFIGIPEDFKITSDINRFSIVVKNILKNSFQFSDSRKEKLCSNINTSQTEDYIIIKIDDNGVGISDEVKEPGEKIYEMGFTDS